MFVANTALVCEVINVLLVDILSSDFVDPPPPPPAVVNILLSLNCNGIWLFCSENVIKDLANGFLLIFSISLQQSDFESYSVLVLTITLVLFAKTGLKACLVAGLFSH